MTESNPPAQRRGPFRRLSGWIASRPAALWARIQPAPRTRRAVSAAGTLVAGTLGGFLGSQLRSGEGRHWDILFGVGVALILVLVTPLLVKLLAALLRFVPSAIGWFGTGALVALALLLDLRLPEESALLLAGIAFAAVALLFGSLAVITSGTFKSRGLFARSFTVLCGLIGLGGAGALGLWIADRGSTDHLVATPVLAAAHQPPVLEAGDPSANGPHQVLTMTYGSGTDERRPEFGAEVDLQTPTVNGKPFASMPKGLRGTMRERFWGFDVSRLPLNGRVWHPDGPGPFPLVLCVHGNHHMAEYSDPGYAYLGELFASRGIVFVSVDENFVNSSAVAGSLRKENDLRAWLLLEHLGLWRQWNSAEGNPFHNRVDLDNIGLVGHSRGGEAVCHAVLFNRLKNYPDDASVAFDYGFSIKGVISIAPIDGQYRPAGRDTVMRDVSYFTIHGGHDADVSSFHGDRLYRRLRFTEPGDHFKASLYVYRANHGQFNTVWGDTDRGAPGAWFLNREALLSGEDQRRIAKVYFGAFFAATLQGQSEYVALFGNHHRGRSWLPDALMVSRFEDASFVNLCDFEEDVDVTTASVAGGVIETENLVIWREADIPLRGGSRRYDNGVFLGWSAEPADVEPGKVDEVDVVEAAAGGEPAVPQPPASYAISLPEDFAVGAADTLVLSLGEAKEKAEAKDYSVTPEETDDEETSEEESAGDEEANEDESDEDEEEEPDADRPPLDVTVELVARDGATAALPLSRFGVIAPPLKVRLTRHDWFENRSPYEPVLQTFALPLQAFADGETGFDPAQLAKIRLVFDRAEKGVVIVDRIGLAVSRK